MNDKEGLSLLSLNVPLRVTLFGKILRQLTSFHSVQLVFLLESLCIGKHHVNFLQTHLKK